MRRKSILLMSILSLCAFPLSLQANLSNGKTNSFPSMVDVKKANAEELSAKGEVLDFNKGWVFTQGELSGEKPESESYNDTSWEKVNLPHDFMIENDFTTQANGEIGHLKGGHAWYRKNFIVPQSLQNKKITITFNGVMSETTIYINGKKVGFYPFGYLPFTFDISSYLKFGENAVNTISLHCFVNTEPGQETARWYSGGGIYRDVNIKVFDQTHIVDNSTKIETLGLKKSFEKVKDLPKEERTYSSDVNVTSTLTSSQNVKGVVVKTTMLDYYTKEPVKGVDSQEVTTDLVANEEREIKTIHHVDNPVLWQPWDLLEKDEKPQLYLIKTEVMKEGKVIQTKYDRFGFRYTDWYSLNEAKASSEIKASGFYLNGKRYEFKGVCLHHDQGALGAVANDYAINRQVAYMKKMGANAIRGTHNHPDPAMLEACDENGFLFIEEFFDTWYDGKKPNDFHLWFEKEADMPDAEKGMTYAEYEIKTIVQRDRNCPSIIMYSIGNEIGASRNDDKGLSWIQKLQGTAHRYDVTPGDEKREEGLRKFTTIGQDNFSTPGNMNYMETVGDNYFRIAHDRTYNWRYYGSETASAVTTRGAYVYGTGHTYDKGYTYLKGKNELSSMDNSAVSWGHTASTALRNQQKNVNQAGEFVWTGFDYIGEPTPWNPGSGYTPKNSYFGITDTAGFAKDNYYLYQSQWLDFEKYPMAHIVAHYNWEEKERLDQYLTPDGKVPVRVYTNAPKVAVFMQKPGQEKVQIGETKTFETVSVLNDETTEVYRRDKAVAGDAGQGELFQEFYIDQYEYLPGTTLSVEIYDKNGKKVTPIDDPSSLIEDEFVINPSNVKVTTADKPYAVKLKQEKQVIQADGQALAYITAEIVDKNGNLCPNADNLIYFNFASDPKYGKIVGVDNGDSSSWERFKDYNGIWRRNAFYGKALVIAQASEVEGQLDIEATSPGLVSDAATVLTSLEYQSIDSQKVLYGETTKTESKAAKKDYLYFDKKKGPSGK